MAARVQIPASPPIKPSKINIAGFFMPSGCLIPKKLDKRNSAIYCKKTAGSVWFVIRYILYNDDVQVAMFSVHNSIITDFIPQNPELLPKQICRASADGFASWLRERTVDSNSVKHRNLMNELVGSRDRITIALRTHMFSISDTFTCFEEKEFVPRLQLCRPEDQDAVRISFWSPAIRVCAA